MENEFIVNDNYIDVLLKYAFKHNATDLHLCAGSKPLVRADRELKLLKRKVLDFSFSKPGLRPFPRQYLLTARHLCDSGQDTAV